MFCILTISFVVHVHILQVWKKCKCGVYAWRSTWVSLWGICMCVCVNVYVRWICLCAGVCVWIEGCWGRVYRCAYLCICVYECVYVYMCVSICVWQMRVCHFEWENAYVGEQCSYIYRIYFGSVCEYVSTEIFTCL